MNAVETDERLGLPSASGFERIINCEACLPLTEYLRDLGLLPRDEGNSDSKYGDKAHDYAKIIARGFELEPEEAKSPEGEEAIELVSIARKIINDVYGDIEGDDRYQTYIEERFWLLDPFTGEKLASGKFDLIVRDRVGNSAVIIDYKTGWNDVSKGAQNAQLAGGAVILSEQFGIDKFHLGIVEVGAKIIVEELNNEGINEWSEKIRFAIANKKANPLKCRFDATPDNCRYCPARLRCPMLRYHAVFAKSANISQAMPDEELEEVLDSVELFKAIGTAAEREMEFRITREGKEFERYEFASSKGNRKFTNAAAACSEILNLGVPAADLFDKVSLPIGAAEKFHKEATGYTGKAAAANFSETFGPYIDAPQTPPKIRKKK